MTSDVVNQLLIIIHQTLRIICMIRKAQWDSPSTQILSSNRRCKRNHATIATRALWVKARDEWKHFSPAWETLEPFFLCDSELNHKTSSWSVWITKVIKYCIWPEWFRALELLFFFAAAAICSGFLRRWLFYYKLADVLHRHLQQRRISIKKSLTTPHLCFMKGFSALLTLKCNWWLHSNANKSGSLFIALLLLSFADCMKFYVC